MFSAPELPAQRCFRRCCAASEPLGAGEHRHTDKPGLERFLPAAAPGRTGCSSERESAPASDRPRWPRGRAEPGVPLPTGPAGRGGTPSTRRAAGTGGRAVLGLTPGPEAAGSGRGDAAPPGEFGAAAGTWPRPGRCRRGGGAAGGGFRGHSLGDLGVQVADPEAVPVLQRALGQDGGVLQRQRLPARLHGPAPCRGRGRSDPAQASPRLWRRSVTSRCGAVDDASRDAQGRATVSEVMAPALPRLPSPPLRRLRAPILGPDSRSPAPVPAPRRGFPRGTGASGPGRTEQRRGRGQGQGGGRDGRGLDGWGNRAGPGWVGQQGGAFAHLRGTGTGTRDRDQGQGPGSRVPGAGRAAFPAWLPAPRSRLRGARVLRVVPHLRGC